MKKRILPAVAVVALIALVAVIWFVGKAVKPYIPTKEHMSSAEYYGIAEDGQVPVILQDIVAPQMSMAVDGIPYLRYETVKKYLNSRFFWDETNGLMLYTTPTDIIKIPAGGSEYTVSENGQDYGHVIVRTDEAGVYLAADFVQQYTDMEYELLEEPARVLIRYRWEGLRQAALKRDAPIRYQGGVKSPIITDGKKGDEVLVLEELEKWTKVSTADGYIGYIRSASLGSVEELAVTRSFEQPEYTRIQKDYRINLVWHQTSNSDSNAALEQDIEKMTGVNTISPTWFSVVSRDGTISSLADADYVKTAHEKGLEVWALVDNFNQQVDMKQVLTNTTAREKLIDELLSEVKKYEIDGLNIDFENLPADQADGFLEFLRELSVHCRREKIVLSADNTVPMEYSAYYERGQQAEVLDYYMVMGYDEHYVGSEVGSVASLGFETEGIRNTIAEGVPADKIISGVPFYTRLWKTDTAGSVTSEAIGMSRAEAILDDNGVMASWDETTGQDYALYHDSDGNLYQIWLENEASLKAKAALVKEYDLAGIAAWKLGLEKDSIWKVLSDEIQ